MEELVQAAWGVAAAAVAALVPVLMRVGVAWAQVAQQRAAEAVQARLGEAAARVAGEIAATVKGSPEVQAATRAMVEAGAAALRLRFAETVAKRGIPASTLEAMVAGELGKLGVPLQRGAGRPVVTPGE